MVTASKVSKTMYSEINLQEKPMLIAVSILSPVSTQIYYIT